MASDTDALIREARECGVHAGKNGTLITRLADALAAATSAPAQATADKLRDKGFTPPPERCKHGNVYSQCRRCDNEFDEEMS